MQTWTQSIYFIYLFSKFEKAQQCTEFESMEREWP